jgi:hypothetical protein
VACSVSELTSTSKKSRDRSVSRALGYGMDDRGSMVRFPAGAESFFLRRRVRSGSGAR